MLETLWDKVGEELAGKWTAQALLPAFAFWGGGLLAYAWRHDWKIITAWWDARAPQEQVAIVIGALILIALSAQVMQRLQGTIVRIAEGYWPWPLRWLRFQLARLWRWRMSRKYERWNELANKCHGQPDQLQPEERAEFARLDMALGRFPVDPARAMPTRLGNVLRAAEEYPQVRYGLSANVCWARLWLLLPEETRTDISGAHEQLNEAAQLCGWSLLFVVWAAWVWWAPLVGLVVASLAYRGMVMAALVYGELMRAAFDLHRFDLYERLRWKPPQTPDAEDALGMQVTEYLHRGTAPPNLAFEARKPNDEDEAP
jgi:hypothetical protein